MKKKNFVFAALMALVLPLAAQESIEKILNQYGSGSIIREYVKDKWVVYTHHNDTCEFIMIDDNTSNIEILCLPPDAFVSVSDFEIDLPNNMLYFCGMMNGDVPCMGYFDLFTGIFPNSTIHYLRLSKLKKLRKLEVVSAGMLAQVVMTGVGMDYDVVVDAHDAGPAWTIDYITPFIISPSINNTLNDIAIVDSFAVVTSQYTIPLMDDDSPTPSSLSYLWYFTRTPGSTSSLSASYVYYKEIPYGSSSNFIIKKCENDIFVVATTNDTYIAGYNGRSHIGSVKILENSGKVVDICYSPIVNSTEVLVEPLDFATNGSKIFTLLPGMQDTSATAFGHRVYNDRHIIKSLINQSSNPVHFICTGECIGNTSDLFLDRYIYNKPKGCTEQVRAGTEPREKNPDYTIAKLIFEQFYQVASKKTPIVKETTIERMCYHD